MTDTLIFVDAETYYDDLFSLRRMTSLEYITDPRFKLHMLAVDETHGQQPAHIVRPSDMPALIDAWRTRQAAGERIGIGAHNVLFDGVILRHHYDFEADFYVDTRSMSKGLWHHESASLAALAERLWPDDPSLRKGHELASSLGVYTLPPDLFESLAGYCQQDTRLCALAYHTMLETCGFPSSELETIDIVARMTITPRLRLDAPLLERYIAHLNTRRRQTVAKSGLHLFAYSYNLDTKGRPQFVKDFERELRKGTTTLEDKDYYLALKVLGSNTAFCAWLGALGIPVPMKPSPTDPRKQTPALGQSDLDYQRMVARYPRHKNVWEARKVAKSNIDLTRAQRFLDIAERFHGRMPMPLTYSAAHTHRFGGCLTADTEVIVYTRNASIKRKRITCVANDDLVWDGENFVQHGGVVFSGMQEVMEHDGIRGTPNHKVFTEAGEISLSEAALRAHKITRTRAPDRTDAPDARPPAHAITQHHQAAVDVPLRAHLDASRV